MHRLCGAVVFVCLLLSGCTQYSASQLAGTATVTGCWPFGFDQPPPTATAPLLLTPSPGRGTPTPIITQTATPTLTPQPTYAACTPLPQTPTLTPSPTPSPTPWTRPTEALPSGKDAPPLNLSNAAGHDSDPAVALHPTDGWAAVVWVHWIDEFPDETVVFVAVQDPQTRAWQRAKSVNTEAVRPRGGNPAILITPDGRLVVAFEQDRQAVVMESADRGQTWSQPDALPMTGGAVGVFGFQLVRDDADQVHALYTQADSCFACFHTIHAQRSLAHAEPWQWQDTLAGGQDHHASDLAAFRLPNGPIRTVVAISRGDHVAVALQDGVHAVWQERTIPDQGMRIADQTIVWVDTITFLDAMGQRQVCVSWGQYALSGVFSSCSRDGGVTWPTPDVLAYHPELAPPLTGTPANPGDQTDHAYRPELLYEPHTDAMFAVWLWRGATSPGQAAAMQLMYSYRPASGGAWLPLIDGATHEPPLPLFGATRRNAAQLHRLAVADNGQAMVAWVEAERDESLEVYVGGFTPAALLTKKEP